MAAIKGRILFYVRAGISMAPSDAGGLDAVQNRTLPHYTEWCIEVRPYCLTNLANVCQELFSGSCTEKRAY